MADGNGQEGELFTLPAGESQLALFDMDEAWRKEWQAMPEFIQEDLSPWKSVVVHFSSEGDMRAFAKLVGQTVLPTTRSIWHPEAEIGRMVTKRYWGKGNPRYPVYVISKGRWQDERRLTSKALEELRVPYRIVVEPTEYENYASVIDPAKILQLPFSNLGQGSIPARNWVWDHATAEGHARHWILDDNIGGFYRLNRNLKTPITSGTIFECAEEFVDRYENVPMAGFNYFMFASRKTVMPPYYLNTRVYSCILLSNKVDYRWRGRYNEDTDLSIRILKDGHCTILFNAFLCLKATTMTMRGGNTDELYKGAGRLAMAESLVEQHPDVARVTEKWGRPQHHVDYSGFQSNKLVRRPDADVGTGIDDHGMFLEEKVNGHWEMARTKPDSDNYTVETGK